jgi:putative ABC transport system substrate-binding protein
MRRREFIAGLGGTAVMPLAARAQQTRRIGILIGTSDDTQGRSWIEAFQQELRQRGWVDGQNMKIDLVWGGANIEHIRASAARLVETKPDVILAYAVRALNPVRQATREIPVVFIATNDPVGLGIVKSLASPGGNLTGFMLYEVSVVGKLVELLKEMMPKLSRVALLYNPTNDSASAYWRLIQSISKANAITPFSYIVHDPATIERAFAEFAREPNGGIVLPADATTTTYWKPIVELSARYRVPVVYSFSSVVASGGLISYGPDTSDLFLRAGSYVDRILKGEHPSQLAVQAPTKFTLAVNLKTAKSMGIEVPTSILLRAHEVHE